MKNKRNLLKIIAIVMVVCLWGTFAACGSSSGSYVSEKDSASNSAAKFDDANSLEYSESITNGNLTTGADDSANQTEEYLDSQKLIYTCRLSIETLEFDESQNQIMAILQKYNGFVEYSNVTDDAHGWYEDTYTKTRGTLTWHVKIRIPSSNYNDFLNGVSEVGKVQSKTEDVENITREYNDVATTIESLKIQEERLLDMMDSCNTIDEMITVEKRLSEIQLQMQRYQTQMNTYNADIAFSTVELTLEEVKQYKAEIKEPNFLERLIDQVDLSATDFLEFCEFLLFAVIYLFPYGIIVGCVGSVIVVAQKNKKNKKKKEKTPIAKSVEPTVEQEKPDVQTTIQNDKTDKK